MNDQHAPKPPQAQKKNNNDSGLHAPGLNQQPPTGSKSPNQNIPKQTPQQKPQPEPPAPARPEETQPPEIQSPKPNSSALQMNSQPANGTGALTNGRGREGKIPGANGSNGHPPRSSLFRPGTFVTMPAVKIPPKAGGPAQKPPATTQIPMEIGRRPDEKPEPGGIPRNEIPQEPQQEPQPPAVPPTPVPSEPPAPESNSTPSSKAGPTGLDLVFQQNQSLPDQTVVFGVCEDGLPVLLDLHNPAPGAVVVIGDDREAQLEFLRTAVASAALRNSPRSVQFLVLSCEPDSWKKWIVENGFERHCLTIESAEEGQVREWILRLADWTEQRRLGESSGPAVLLVMDTLSFLSQLEYDVRLNFDWMAKEGPQAQIWPLAVISTDLAKAMSGRRLLRGFQTRIIGYANQPADIIQLAGVDAQEAETFSRRGEFAVKVGENWLRFRLPGR
ncbi:MAG: hypothetical protein EHM21_00635 [Chloroflexi bacterium]|nr:MAG: hypothetical protein EHM21_00635 [Chloroflexota bacterium]